MTPTTITQPPRHITGLEELPFLPWLDDAACLGEDPDLWFADYGRNREARAICLGCPLFFACTHWGITHPEHGMWGGLGDHARTRIRHQGPVTVKRYDLTPFRRAEAS